jgi:hypothetical protein
MTHACRQGQPAQKHAAQAHDETSALISGRGNSRRFACIPRSMMKKWAKCETAPMLITTRAHW